MSCFDHLDIRYLDLPFDLAQGGELVEFRYSNLGFNATEYVR